MTVADVAEVGAQLDHQAVAIDQHRASPATLPEHGQVLIVVGEWLGQIERVAAQHVYVVEAKRPDSLDIFRANFQPHTVQLRQNAFDVARVPEDDGVDYQSQSSKLVFLSLTVSH